jgi:hypothetical protein
MTADADFDISLCYSKKLNKSLLFEGFKCLIHPLSFSASQGYWILVQLLLVMVFQRTVVQKKTREVAMSDNEHSCPCWRALAHCHLVVFLIAAVVYSELGSSRAFWSGITSAGLIAEPLT